MTSRAKMRLFAALALLSILCSLPVSAAPVARACLESCLDGGATGSYAIQNSSLGLQIQLEDGRLQQLQLRDVASGRILAKGATPDDGKGAFFLTLLQPGTGEQVELGAANFRFSEASVTTARQQEQLFRRLEPELDNVPAGDDKIALDGVANWANTMLRLHLTYTLPAGSDFVQARLALDPVEDAPGWVVSNAVTLRWQLDSAMTPTPRNAYLDSALYYQKRWKLPPNSWPGNWWLAPNGAGFYGFSNSPFGREYFQANNLYLLDQYDHQPVSEGFTGSPVALGYYFSGGAEMGYTRYVEYLTKYVSRLTRNNKTAPVFFNTWIPWTNRIDQGVLDRAFEQTRQAGYYNLLHIDAGWEGSMPLQIDTQKFPGGFDYIQQKAHEQNMGLSLWINPYSDSYFGYVNYETLHRTQRDWHVPLTEGFLPKQGFNRGAFQVLSPYSDYVEERLVELVSKYDIRMLYWDGADWNIRDSEVDFLDNAARQRLKVLGIKRLNRIVERLYAIRPDLIIVGWNAWVDPHLLSIFDQQQVTDMFTAPLGLAEVARRKIYYGMSFVMPFSTIWSDWYGLTYNERKDAQNLNLPQSQLEYAELSMLSKGIKEAGGTIDQNAARPQLKAFLKDLFNFRRQFDRYFDVYQRLTDAPDNNRADASGHFIDGKGFIIFNNPTNLNQQVRANLNPYILGLKPGKTYSLYDWTNLKQARPSGTLSFSSEGTNISLTQSLPPRTVRILALDLNQNVNPLPAQGKEGS